MGKIPYTIKKTEYVNIELDEIEIINLAIKVIEKTFDIPQTGYIDGKNIVHIVNEGMYIHNEKYRKSNKKDKEIIKLREKLQDIKSDISYKNK